MSTHVAVKKLLTGETKNDTKAINVNYFCACYVNSVYVEITFILIIHVMYIRAILFNFDLNN